MSVSFNLRDKAVSINDSIATDEFSIVQRMLNNAEIVDLHISGIDINLLPLLNLEHLKSFSIGNMPCFDLGFLGAIKKLESLRLSFELSSFGKKVMLHTIPENNNLTSLTLNSVSGLKNVPAFNNLKEIGLSSISNESLDFLTGYPDLKDIFISRSTIKGFNILLKLNNLVRLRIIQGRQIDFASIAAEKISNNSLRILELSHCPSLTDFSFLQRFHALKYMDITSCRNLASFKGIENCPNLEVVNISECKSRDKNLDYLAGIKNVFVGISYTKEQVQNFEKKFTGDNYSIGKFDKGKFDYLEHFTKYFTKYRDEIFM